MDIIVRRVWIQTPELAREDLEKHFRRDFISLKALQALSQVNGMKASKQTNMRRKDERMAEKERRKDFANFYLLFFFSCCWPSSNMNHRRFSSHGGYQISKYYDNITTRSLGIFVCVLLCKQIYGSIQSNYAEYFWKSLMYTLHKRRKLKWKFQPEKLSWSLEIPAIQKGHRNLLTDQIIFSCCNFAGSRLHPILSRLKSSK